MQLKRVITAMCLSAIAMSAQASDNSSYEEATLVIEGQKPVAATINGQPVQLIIAPDSKSIPTLNDGLAERLQLKPSMIGFAYLAGPEKIHFWTDVTKLDFGPGIFSRRTAFGKNHIIEGVDGEAGPGALPYGVVRFDLHVATPGERILTFPMDRIAGANVGTTMTVGSEELAVNFSLSRRETLVTATAGAMLASQYTGHFTGEAKSTLLRYGVFRPTRMLAFQSAPMLGELTIRDIAVRVADNGDASAIKDNNAANAADTDPDEIVVTAQKAGKKKDKKRQMITIGLASLETCSSITYDFRAEQIRLSCI